MSRPDAGIARSDTSTDGTQFCRVTVLAPHSRMDLALPVDLTVAELVPMLTELAGESGRSAPGGPAGPWCLAAVAGAELPPQATLTGLGVLDGDLLRLRRRTDAPPPPIFDDPVDAVAESVHRAEGGPAPWSEQDGPTARPVVLQPWTDRYRRPAGLLIAGLAGLAAAVLLAGVRGFGAQANPVAAVAAALATLAVLTAAWRTSRYDTTAAVALAFTAAPLASSAGFAALPGVPGAGHVLLCAALAAASTAAALALLNTAAPVLVAVVLASLLTAPAALVRLFGVGGTAGLAAAVAAVAVGLLPLLPRLSVRLAGLPTPIIPTTPDEMITADARWEAADPRDVRHRSELAHAYLAGLVLGCSLVASVGAVLAAGAGGWAGPLFGSVVVTVLLLRSRGYVTAAASGTPLAAGALAGTVLAVGLARTGPELARLGVGIALVVAASVSAWLVRTGPQRDCSPVVHKAVDVVEAILVVITFPLALGVLDIYQIVRNGL